MNHPEIENWSNAIKDEIKNAVEIKARGLKDLLGFAVIDLSDLANGSKLQQSKCAAATLNLILL